MQKRRYLSTRNFNSPRIPQTFSFDRKNRLLTTTSKKSNRIKTNKRKKKLLSPSSNEKFTTKDRLRLSDRPSSNSQRSGSDLFDASKMIKSPEELAERLNSGLDMARAAVKESYASLRNPSTSSSGKNHLLAARPPPSSIGTDNKPSQGLLMDANWWFWNILLAASPSVLIALYCEYVVKPEMQMLNQEKEKEESSRGKDEMHASVDDTIGDKELNSGKSNKLSPMRKRQEEQKQEQKQKQLGGDATTNPSSHPPKNSGDRNYFFLSYISSLASWFVEELPLLSKDNSGHEKRRDEVEKSNTYIKTNESEDMQNVEQKEMDIYKHELKALQSQLRILKEKIDHKIKECADSNIGNITTDSDALSDESLTRKITKISEDPMRREWWVSLLSWGKSYLNCLQTSDESNCDIDIYKLSKHEKPIEHDNEKVEKANV